MTNMTTRQAATARRLARGFGHEWASLDITAGMTDPEVIAEATCASRVPCDTDCPLGIDAPFIDELGCVLHETAGRRLRWSVLRSGLAVVTVHRPSGPIIEAVIDLAEGWTGRLMAPRHDVHRRHVAALERALHALGMTRRPRLARSDERNVYWVGTDILSGNDYDAIVDAVASRLVTLDHAELVIEPYHTAAPTSAAGDVS